MGVSSLTCSSTQLVQEADPDQPLEDMAVTAGSWRRPRMKVYDYNQEFGGNYYQPMIQYLNKKDIYGPFHSRDSVYLPHSAEVTSDKYTNMRYSDKSSAKHNLDQFLQSAYSKQIRELNGTTAMAGVNVMKSIVSSRRQPHTSIDKSNRTKLENKQRRHLAMLQACDEYEYHHKLFGQGAVERDIKFHNPQLIRDYINQIRRV